MRPPGPNQARVLSRPGDVQPCFADVDRLQLKQLLQEGHRHHALVAERAVVCLHDLRVTAQDGGGAAAQDADVRAQDDAVQGVGDLRQRVAGRVAPLIGARQCPFVARGIAVGVENQLGSPSFAIEQDQVGGLLGGVAQGVVVRRRVVDIRLRHRGVQAVVLGAAGFVGGAKLHFVRLGLTADQGFRHGEALGEVVLPVLELLLADRYARQNLVCDHPAVAVGDGDRRQFGIDGKWCIAHGALLQATGRTAGAM